jgi:quercetin dioxygenase-like cupin family protein
MRSTIKRLIAVGLAGLLVLILSAQTERGVVKAQTHKPIYITRLYTGPDGQSHAEDIEAKFDAGTPGNVFKMMEVTGAEIHRVSPGTMLGWHPGPRRQYVITLSGHGEIEVAGGKKIAQEPGHILLVEDTTGKGHVSKATGTEDLATLWLPLTDPSAR